MTVISGDELILRLRELYADIDAAYRAFAREVGLSCEGCDGVACCTVDLTLHTFVEMLYLRRGFNTLDVSRQLEILGRCRAMVKAREDDPFGEAYRSAVCALNMDGQCVLYEFRPMICRLAGIPHVIARPDGSTVESGGCAQYEQEIREAESSLKLDRSSFYRKMAELEIAIVHETGRRTSPRTVAEILGLEDLDEDLPWCEP